MTMLIRRVALVVLLCWASGVCAAGTVKHNLSFGSHETENSNLSNLDRRIPLTANGRPPIQLFFCGQLPNNTTQYFGAPDATNIMGYGATACDAEDSTTEATADDVVWLAPLRFLGMCCQVSSSGSNGVTLTARSAAADISPTMTMTIATGTTTGCAFPTSDAVLPTIAAGATMAIKAVDTENLATADAGCMVWLENQ